VRSITYEILVQQGSRWEIHARYRSSQKDAALNEAKSLELLPKITAVKVIKETHDTEDGNTQEATIYKSAGGTGKHDADTMEPTRSRVSPASRRKTRKGTSHGNTQEATAYKNVTGTDKHDADTIESIRSRVSPALREQTRKGASRRTADRVAEPRPAQRAPSTKIGVFTRILLVIFFSIAFAAMLTGVAALSMPDYSLFDISISADTYANILFGIFVLGFLFSAIPLAIKFLSKEYLASNAARKRPTPAPTRPAQKPGKTGKKVADLHETPPPPFLIDTEHLPASANEKPAKEEKAEQELAEEALPSDDVLSPAIEPQKVYMMTFLGQALEHVKTASESMDKFNKFGVSLFLAGACEAMSSDRNLTAEDGAAILGELVKMMGFKKDRAILFANKFDEYLLADSRYMRMYQAGRNAMNTFMGGDFGGASQLQDALVEWDKPKPKEAGTGPITVMFTDMVGSTNLTQTRGDEVAQHVVRAHNRIVRDALNKYDGKEVKHTGDGIMASFRTTSNGVEAAIFIQQKTAAHNLSNVDLPLHLKIGINAGEPIAEDDDLFGTTVQLAARIVDKARSEKIFVSEIVRGICTGKNFRFAKHDNFDMKGFAEPITLFEVLWEEGQAIDAQRATHAGTKQTPATPAVTALKPVQEPPTAKTPSPAPGPLMTPSQLTQAATGAAHQPALAASPAGAVPPVQPTANPQAVPTRVAQQPKIPEIPETLPPLTDDAPAQEETKKGD
jgi:adenylate cyclase